jgi:hypothetical protein
MPSSQTSTQLQSQLTHHVRQRTGRRVRGLAVEFCSEGIILHGQADSYYVKQLAQQGIRELLPNVVLQNAIVVG